MAKSKKTLTFDGYLQALSDDFRLALERLRKVIHATAPGAEECVSYGLAAFRHNGRMLVALGATKSHCGFYLMSNQTVAQFAEELKSFETSTGTIRFTPDQPLPIALVRKLVRARIAENKALSS
ncbi:MAG: DUF1801 domain-containing protein [Planctomycetaceae bacterium]|jgi:uncharacterized protein YdhG (YjbR/CyaY superfamily)|nr:DUF1801 domain-containing protein [Planctomycetaceae bacterium]